jgi:hypothetical protein
LLRLEGLVKEFPVKSGPLRHMVRAQSMAPMAETLSLRSEV